jgi:predicted metal-dependent phosphoesterase TrpH
MVFQQFLLAFYYNAKEIPLKTLFFPFNLMLKSDLHIHTKGDPVDGIKYSPKKLIDYAAKLNFKILAITNHHSIHYDSLLADYAKKKGILLIPGMETRIGNKEVLLLNIKKPVKLEKFSDLEKLRKENVVVVAPHSFYPGKFCLQEKLIENINYFDLIEYCHFYTHFIKNYNNQAVKIAKKYKKPLIGNSDAHNLFQINHTYSFIDADMNIDSVLESLRKGKVKVQTKPLSPLIFSRIFFLTIFNTLKKKTQGKDSCLF